MKAVEFRIISIGALAAHPLWNERGDVRTGHATTTLISTEGGRILVDPGLPGPILEARLAERSGLAVQQVTHVFLTSFTIEHCRGLDRFADAEWLLHGPEREAAVNDVARHTERAQEIGDPAVLRMIDEQRERLDRCRAADDHILPGVDLFPLPGVSRGACGLLLSQPAATVLVCGDAVATTEHLEQGKVLPTCADVEQALESFREAIEIADVIVPGRDNVLPNPMQRRL